MADMYTPTEIRRWTMPESYFGATWPDYYYAPCGRHRDSDDLAESNFAACLERLGGESETVIVVRESHWAVGWVEWIAIHESDDKALEEADQIARDIADYPALDEDDWSEREMESANDVWRDCYDVKSRVKYIRENRDQFEFRDWRDMRQCVKGDYFGGYASELLS